MINHRHSEKNRQEARLVGSGRTLGSRAKSGSTLLPRSDDGKADEGIIDRMRDYRDWWNIPSRRSSGANQA